MANITLKGHSIHTRGDLPAKASLVEDFSMINTELGESKLSDYSSKKKILNIFPSIDTGVCASSVKAFNQKISTADNLVVLCLSLDLPFAHKRFCGAEGIDKVEVFSLFRSDFLEKYPIEMTDGPLKGLCSRCIILLDENNRVVYTEQVPEITQEPNYQAVLDAV